MQWIKWFGLLLVFAVPAVDAVATDVVIEFGPSIERRMDRLENYEQTRERQSRDRWSRSDTHSPAKWFANSTGSERLIPDLREFSVHELAMRMAEYNLQVMGAEKDGQKLIIKINDFYGQRFQIAGFSGPYALVKGEVILLDAEGKELFSDKLFAHTSAQLLRKGDYHGEGHPYPSRSFQSRVGPLFAIFFHKAMKRAYPDLSDKVPNAVARPMKYFGR